VTFLFILLGLIKQGGCCLIWVGFFYLFLTRSVVGPHNGGCLWLIRFSSLVFAVVCFFREKLRWHPFAILSIELSTINLYVEPLKFTIFLMIKGVSYIKGLRKVFEGIKSGSSKKKHGKSYVCIWQLRSSKPFPMNMDLPGFVSAINLKVSGKEIWSVTSQRGELGRITLPLFGHDCWNVNYLRITTNGTICTTLQPWLKIFKKSLGELIH